MRDIACCIIGIVPIVQRVIVLTLAFEPVQPKGQAIVVIAVNDVVSINYFNPLPLFVVINVFNVFNRYLYSGSPYGNYYYYQAEAPRNFRLSIGYKF